jgi:hypothetical protein
MGAKILYVAKGTDPAAVYWPQVGPTHERWKFNSGQVSSMPDLIGYGDGTITYPDGRLFPAMSSQGSTFVHQKN